MAAPILNVDCKSRTNYKLNGLIVFLFLFCCTPAFADPITFQFSGTAICFPCIPNNFHPRVFNGSYTFDSKAFTARGGPFGVSLNLGGLLLTWHGVRIGISRHVQVPRPPRGFVDRYIVTFLDPDPGIDASGNFIYLEDPTVDYFTNDDVPLTPPPLGLFWYPVPGEMVVFSGNFGQVFGELTSLTVPEPGTFVLVIMGLASFVFWAVRYKVKTPC